MFGLLNVPAAVPAALAAGDAQRDVRQLKQPVRDLTAFAIVRQYPCSLFHSECFQDYCQT